MGQSVKQRKRKAGKYNYKRNLKRLNTQMQKKDNPDILNETVKPFWNSKKTARNNMTKLGLVADLNKTMQLAGSSEAKGAKKTKPTKVVQMLLEDAKPKVTKMKNISPKMEEFCGYLLDKYGEDYEAMTTDQRNFDQHTQKQLKNLINKFKSSPTQYAQFLKKRGMLDEESTDVDMPSSTPTNHQ